MQGNERARSDLKLQTKTLESRRLPKEIRVVKTQYDRMEPGMNLVNSPGQDETDTSIPYMVMLTEKSVGFLIGRSRMNIDISESGAD